MAQSKMKHVPKIAVLLMADSESGKSRTLNDLFLYKKTGSMKRGWQHLYMGGRHLQAPHWHNGYTLDVFVMPRSCRDETISYAELFKKQKYDIRILLGSIHNSVNGLRCIEELEQRDFEVHVIWLEPGHKAKSSRKSAQKLANTGIAPNLIQKGIPLVKTPARNIAKTHDIIRRKIAGWAQYHL